jgi:hypothetical protein
MKLFTERFPVTRHEIKVSPVRWTVGLGMLFGWSALMVAAARAAGPVGAALAAPLFTIPLISLGEWLVHGVLYHGKLPGLRFIRDIHHAGHHFALFPPKKYVQHGEYEFMRFRAPVIPFQMSDNKLDNLLTMWTQVALHFVVGIPLILVPAWLLTHSTAFFWSTLATLAFISWLLGYVHGVIHTPRERAIEYMRWFQWLDRHHYIHHVDLSANINFLLPICDFLFGTQKWALTDEEQAAHPTFEEAKPQAKDIEGPLPDAA